MMMWPIADLVPHSGQAILLDKVVRFDDDTLQALAIVPDASPFHDEEGLLPNWMGLEFMAQAVAAWAGCQARAAGEDVVLGFLLGTRRYDCSIVHFTPGMSLIVDVERSLQDASGMGVFECRLSSGQEVLATARLNVYRPKDPKSFTNE